HANTKIALIRFISQLLTFFNMKLINAVLLFFGVISFTACDKYLDLVPTGSQLVSTTQDYYDLVAWPNRGYPVNNFQYLVDDQWMRESYVIGVAPNINTINFLFQESEDRMSRISSSSMYNQAYKYIGQWNSIISLVDGSQGEVDLKQLAKAEAKIFRAYDHFLLVRSEERRVGKECRSRWSSYT